MPSLEFEVYCGICGRGCCRDTTVNGDRITVTCRDCEDKISDLQEEIQSLQEEIENLKEAQ